MPKILHLPVCVTFLKNIKFPKWSCVLKFSIECPGILFPDAETNEKDDVNIPLIRFHYY